MSPAVLTPGCHATLSWHRSGGRGAVRRLTLRLEGMEIHGHGKYKRRLLLHQSTLADIPSPGVESVRPIDFTVPADARPTCVQEDVRVEWTIHVLTEVPRRPVATDEHGIEVKAATR